MGEYNRLIQKAYPIIGLITAGLIYCSVTSLYNRIEQGFNSVSNSLSALEQEACQKINKTAEGIINNIKPKPHEHILRKTAANDTITLEDSHILAIMEEF
jgi:hypothetical protein